MSKSQARKKQKQMIEERDRKLALKKGVTVKKLKEDRLRDNRSTLAAAASVLPFGGAAIKGGSALIKGASKLKSATKAKPKTTTTRKTTTTTTSPKSTGGVRFSRKKPATTTKKQKQQSVLVSRKQKQAAAKKDAPKTTARSRVKSFVAKNKKPLALGAGAAAVTTSLLSGSKKAPAKKPQAMPKPRPKTKTALPKPRPKGTQNVAPKMKRTNITAGKNTGFGPKGNIFPGSSKERKELMEKYGGTGSAAAKAAAQGTQGSMLVRANNGLKPPPEGNKGKGVRMLPESVRNNMGFMKKGGKVMKKKRYI